MSRIRITNSIYLDEAELEEKFVRSGGPGGQNVNKVSTAVQLRFDVKGSPNLSERVRQKILASGDSRITKSGELVIIADTNRTQDANRKEAIARLKEIIRKAAIFPKKRIPTRPTLASRKRNQEYKARRKAIKKARSGKIDPYRD